MLSRCPQRLLEVVTPGAVTPPALFHAAVVSAPRRCREGMVTMLRILLVPEQMVALAALFVDSICLRKFSGRCLLFLPKQR